MIYFTADHHFGHNNIIKLCNRPFQNLNEMNDSLIEKWNSTVSPDDDVYHLGDLTYKAKPGQVKEILSKLNGKIYLLVGNHDKITLTYKERFEWIRYYHEMEINKQFYVLCHYPIGSWNKMNRGSIHLFGHCHGSYQSKGKALDVGVDVHEFQLLTIENINSKLNTKKIEKVDHHV